MLTQLCCAACRYELSEEKTFASLFHPDKAAILRLVEHFVKKEGKVIRNALSILFCSLPSDYLVYGMCSLTSMVQP